MVTELIAQYHPDLAMAQEEIVVIFKQKASMAHGQPILGKTKKAPPILGVLTDKKYEYRFIIELAADQWQLLDQQQRQALLDHHLCSMMVEEDPESGNVKYGVRPPDFVCYSDEISRHGMWRPLPEETLDAVESAFQDNGSSPQVRKPAEDASDILGD